MFEYLAPIMTPLMIVLSLGWLSLILTRPWIGQGLQALKLDRNAALWWLIGCQVLFWSGVVLGKVTPALSALIQRHAHEALGHIGLKHLSGMVELAGGIFIWNSAVGLMLTGFANNLLYGAGALVMPLRSLAVGVALSQQSTGVLLAHAPTILIELSAYALVGLAGYAALRAAVARGLQSQVSLQGVRDLSGDWWIRTRTLLPLSLTLLLIGAWYEAAEIHWILPLLK